MDLRARTLDFWRIRLSCGSARPCWPADSAFTDLESGVGESCGSRASTRGVRIHDPRGARIHTVCGGVCDGGRGGGRFGERLGARVGVRFGERVGRRFGERFGERVGVRVGVRFGERRRRITPSIPFGPPQLDPAAVLRSSQCVRPSAIRTGAATNSLRATHDRFSASDPSTR